MGFKDYLEEKRKEEQKKSNTKSEKTSSSGGFKKYLETVNDPNNRTNVGTSDLTEDDVSKWSNSVGDIGKRAYNYLATDGYKKADTALAEEINKHIEDSHSISQYLRANKSKFKNYDEIYNGYIEQVNYLKDLQKSITDSNEYFSKFKTEKEYEDHKIGWLNPEAETNAETASARQERYHQNEARLKQMEEDLPWYAATIMPDFMENWFLSDEDEKKKVEYETLKAENNQYKRTQSVLDEYYTPETPEFLANGAERNYTNASKEDLQKRNATQTHIESLLSDGNHYYDSNGNIINATTKQIEYTADDLTRAMYKDSQDPFRGGFFDTDKSDNATDQYYNNLVQDKLGMFLSASEDDLATAYSELASAPTDVNNTWARVLQEGDQNAWKYLEEHELNIYYNLYKTQGQAAAYEYLDKMTTELTRRETVARQKEIDEASWLEQLWLNAKSVPQNVFGGALSFVEDAANMARGEDINPYSRAHSFQNDAQYVRQVTAQEIDEATGGAAIPWIDFSFGDAYQALMSAADSTVGAMMGGSTYGTLMGMGAASSTMKDLWEKGADAGQMFAGGILSGAAEMIFEKYSIDKLVKIGDSKTIGQFIINGLKQGGVEASEEMLTEIANTITNSIVMGSQSDWVDAETFAKNVVNAGLSGFMSGGAMGGTVSAINYNINKSQFKQAGADIIEQGATEELLNLANEMAGVTGDKTLFKYSDKAAVANQNKAGSKKAALEVGRTSALLQDNITEQNQGDIQDALIEKGLDKKDAKRVSEYLASTKELTEEQIAEVKGNENIKAVAKELLGDPESKINERQKKYIAAKLGVKYETNVSNITTKSGDIAVNTEVDVKDKVSADGKTVQVSTGEAITINKDNAIAKIKTVDGERVVYLNTDKGVVASNDVNYANENEALVYESFVDLNPAFANAVIKNYDNNVPMQTYIKGMREGIILYGMHNFQGVGKDISKNTYFAELSAEDQAFALKLGSAYADMVAKKQGKTLRTAIKNAAEKAEVNKNTSTKATSKKGRVSFEGGVVAKGKLQKRTVSLAKHLARAIGIDIVFYDARTTTDENSKGANGYFDEDTNTIHLDLQNSASDAKTIAFTLSHELVHFIKKWSPEKFNTFSKFLMENYAKHGVNTSQLLANKMADLGTKDADLAYEEMIADACETMLLDSNAVYKLMELRKADLELFEKIKLHIYELLNKLRNMYKELGLQPTSDEAKALLKMTDVLEQMYALFEEAAVDATQTYQAALETEAVSVSEDGTIRMQMKQYEQTGRSTLLKYLKEQYGEADANDLIATIDNVYNAMAEIKKDTALSVFGNWQDTEVELDENGHPIFTTSINNGDYKLNQDFSRVCKKRRQLDFVLNMLAEDPAFEASNLTKDDIVKINQAIKKHGFEIACALCFVDSKRFRQTEWADSFANTWNDILYSVVDDNSKLTPFNFATNSPNLSDDGIEIDTSKPVMYRKWSDGKEDVKNRKNYDSFDSMLEKKANGKFVEGNANVRAIVKILKENPHLRHTFRGADIIGSQGFDTIQRLAPNIRGILDGWGGTSVPKPSSNDAIYDNSVLNIAGYNAKSAFAIGGVRMNSFSDFMAHMFFDYVQAFADLSAKGLPMHSYTKELDFARLFGLTKGKINMSAIAAIRENATDLSKIKKKADKEKATEWEKSIAGLDISKLAEKLGKAETDITYDDVIQNLNDCDYVWADESIDVRSATLLQSGIMYDNLTEGKAAYCYELIKEGKFEEAFKVAGEKNVNRDYAKHLGIITVGVSKAHILKLLRDPTIRMVIPYHKSGLNAQVAAALKIAFYEDFTDVQNTMLMKSDGSTVGLSKDGAKIGDKNIRDFNFYKYFGKEIDGVFYDGKATAAKYLEWCEKGEYNEDVGEYGYYLTDGRFLTKAELDAKGLSVLPKFGEFAAEENYYKLIEDFDCYDTITGEHSSQEAVDFFHDGLPADYKNVLVKALKAEQKVSDDFRDHLDNHGLRDEVMDIVKARGYKPSVKKQLKKAADKDYLEAVNRGDMETAQRMVDEAAEKAGYNSPKLYHGTKAFGFTQVKTSGVEKGVDWSPFFAANMEDISATYVPYGKVREISSSMDDDAIEEARENAIEERKETITDLVGEFRHLIDRYFSEWVFGQTDNSYLEGLVEKANPEAGYGDGVYDVLSEIVYDCFYDYQDDFAEYEDADDWEENSPEAKKIFSIIVEIEGEKSALHRLELGEELGGIYQLYANLDNMFVVDGKGAAWNELHPEGLPKIERGVYKDVPYKTRDVAEWARENGFDGVIFKNIRDNGAYGRTPAGDVYVFFKPESQLKSADPVTYDDKGNVIPLSERFNKGNNDIRFQKKRTVTPFSSSDYTKLEKHFGTTTNYEVAGYLLNNGKMLDFSGKHWGDNHSTSRQVDHRDVWEVWENRDRDGVDEMVNMIGNGNIRLMPEVGGINLAAAPNEAQRKTLLSYIRHFRGEIIVDIDEVGGDTIQSFTYNRGTAPMTVIRDIMAYFEDGIIPQKQPEYRQFMFQKKKVSNRTILSNALESAIDTSTQAGQNELKLLKQYQDKIDTIEKEEAHLAEVNAQIKEISFGKNTDRSKLKDLNEDKVRTNNRINIYDKQLMRLEAMKPIKDILTREKEMVRKRTEEKGREALANYRKEALKVRNQMIGEARKETRQKISESRSKTEMRHKIKKVVGDLRKLLNRGTKERNVKLELQDAVGKALTTAEVLFSNEITNADIVRLGVESVTPTEEKALNKYAELLDKLDKTTDEAEIKRIKGQLSGYDARYKDLFIRERARLNKGKVSDALTSLANAYADLKNSTDDYVKNNAYVEGMHEKIVNLSNDLQGVTIRDMSYWELKMVYDMYAMVKHMVQQANSIFREGKYEDLMTNISNVQMELDEISTSTKDPTEFKEKIADFLRGFTWNELKPYAAFERLGSQTFQKLFWDVVEADNVWARDIEEAKNVIESARKKHGFKKWDTQKAVTIKSANGLDFKLTLEDMMSIYAYSKRPQAEDHMTVGGFVFDVASTYKDKKGKFTKTYKHKKLSETYRVDHEVIQSVMKELAKVPGAMQYVDEVQGYLTKLGEKGNEVSRVMYGIDLFKEEVYFPLQSAADYRSSVEQTLNATQTTASLKNIGMSKETVPKASNPIVLKSFDNVALDHINQMAKYHAYVVPIENLSKVFNNVNKGSGEYISTQALISSKFGESAKRYFNQFITDLNGGSLNGGASNPLANMFATSKAVSVGANMSVFVQQYFAIVRALDEMNPKYFVPFLNGEASKSNEKQYEELKKYAPVGIIKQIGGFDMGANRSALDYIGDTETRLDAKKVRRKVKDAAMWLPGKMDEIGWSTIWRAVKKEIADTTNHKVGTKEFFEACGKRFTEIVAKTQVYDSVTSRSGYMRSKHETVKYLTSFMGEPTAIVNKMFTRQLELHRAIKSKDKSRIKAASAGIARTSTVLILSTVLTSLAKSLPYAMRDDDEEDKALLERWAKHFGEATFSDMNPLNMLPVGRDLVSIWEGWDVERPDTTLISDIFTTFKKAMDDGCTAEEAMDLAGSLSNILGYPLKNVIRDVKGIVRLVGDIADDITPTDIGGAFGEGFIGEDKSKDDRLYDAVVNGDTARIEVLKSNYDTDSKYNTALAKAIVANDSEIVGVASDYINEEFSSYDSKVDELIALGFTPDSAVKAIKKVIGLVEDAAQAEADGDTETYDEKVKELLGLGYDESQLMADVEYLDAEPSDDTEKAKSRWEKDDYVAAVTNGDTTMAEIIKADLIETDIQNGKTEDEAEKSLDNALNRGYKEDFFNGDMSESEVESWIKKTHPDYTTSDIYWELKRWKKEKEHQDDPDYSYSKYGEYYEAILNGDTRTMNAFKFEMQKHNNYKTKVNTQVANVIKKTISDHFRPIYKEATPTERKKLKAKLLTAYTSLGFAYGKMSVTIDKWLTED